MSELPDETARLEELLAEQHQFPGLFVFKAIGRGDELFIAAVLEVVRLEIGPDVEFTHELQHSSGGKHVSVTLRPQVQSAAQVVAIYSGLRTVDGLRMLL